MIELELLNLAYELRNTRTVILKNTELPPILSMTTLARGSEITLPNWIAKVLEEEGYVEIEEKLIAPSDISKTRFVQVQQRDQPIKLDEFFYTKVKGSIQELEIKAKKEGDYILMSTIERVKQDVVDLFKFRLNIILRAIQLGGAQTLDRQLSLEEKVLLQGLNKTVKKWIDTFINL